MSHVLDMLSELRLPHWLMFGGGVLVVLGTIGLVIHRIMAPTASDTPTANRPEPLRGTGAPEEKQ
jgi:hypothetical protein